MTTKDASASLASVLKLELLKTREALAEERTAHQRTKAELNCLKEALNEARITMARKATEYMTASNIDNDPYGGGQEAAMDEASEILNAILKHP